MSENTATDIDQTREILQAQKDFKAIEEALEPFYLQAQEKQLPKNEIELMMEEALRIFGWNQNGPQAVPDLLPNRNMHSASLVIDIRRWYQKLPDIERQNLCSGVVRLRRLMRISDKQSDQDTDQTIARDIHFMLRPPAVLPSESTSSISL
ncbi:MAG TPA: hypothetical protein VJJ80_01985 [Patescibacteria group bacterium]|nr:hypothetical protein [Patescibacteria group bacterium]